LRNLIPGESPGGDLRLVPEHGENATSGHVEGVTSTSIDVGEGTTIVVTVRAQAIGWDEVSGKTLAGRAVRVPEQGLDVGVGIANAVGAGMESVLVGRIVVDELDDVNLQGNVEWIRWFKSDKEMVVTSPPFGQFWLEGGEGVD
jgi:hypothetical protein